MAKGKKRKGFKEDVEAYRHEAETRKNAVPVGFASYGTSKPKPKKYGYDLHLDLKLISRQWNTLFYQQEYALSL